MTASFYLETHHTKHFIQHAHPKLTATATGCLPSSGAFVYRNQSILDCSMPNCGVQRLYKEGQIWQGMRATDPTEHFETLVMNANDKYQPQQIQFSYLNKRNL